MKRFAVNSFEMMGPDEQSEYIRERYGRSRIAPAIVPDRNDLAAWAKSDPVGFGRARLAVSYEDLLRLKARQAPDYEYERQRHLSLVDDLRTRYGLSGRMCKKFLYGING